MTEPKNPEKLYDRVLKTFFGKLYPKASAVAQGLGQKYFKAVDVVMGELRKIHNTDKAFYHALVYSSATTFYHALRKYRLEVPAGNDHLVLLRDSLLRLCQDNNYKAEEFDLENFNRDPAVQKILEHYAHWMKNQDTLDQTARDNVTIHFKDFFVVDFYELLEDSQQVYAQLTEFLRKDSYKARLKVLRRKTYHRKLSLYYLEPVHLLQQQASHTPAPGLREVYVAPYFKLHTRCVADKLLEEKDLEYNEYTSFGDLGLPEQDLHTYVNALLRGEDLMHLGQTNARMLFLLGYPGQGKSSFCKRLMHDWATREDLPLPQAMYFIKLRDIKSPRELLNDPLRVLHKEAERLTDNDIEERDFAKSWLILDGLDELIMNNGLSDTEVDGLCRAFVHETCKSEAKLKIMVTSRHGYIGLHKLPQDRAQVSILQLRGFSLAQQTEWLQKYKVYYPNTQLTPDLLKTLNQNKHQYEAIKELLEQPILLSIVALLDAPLNEHTTKVKMYGDLFDMLTERKYAADGKNEAQGNINPKKLRHIIQDIALKIYRSPYEYVYYDQLQQMANDDWEVEVFEGSLKNLMVSFYFKETERAETDTDKTNRDTHAVEFLHKSLQEYMVAEKIWREVQELSPKKESFFREVHELFAPKMLSREVATDLVAIIGQAPEPTRQKVAAKFGKYFEELLHHDFLYKYEYSKNRNVASPIDQTLHTFYGFWTVLVHLLPGADYTGKLGRDYQQKFCELIGHYCPRFPFFNASFQQLKKVSFWRADLEFINLTGVHLKGANLIGANLTEAHLTRANLRGAHLTGADLTRAYLKEADLRGADLTGVHLTRARLTGADLTGANLTEANLRGANLTGANLRGADLTGADLREADLTGADLTGAHLTGADLTGANLREANLREADLIGADLTRANLTEVVFSLALLPDLGKLENAEFNKTTCIEGAYTWDSEWLTRFEATVHNQGLAMGQYELIEVEKMEVDTPFTKQYLELLPDGALIYQIVRKEEGAK